MEAGHEAQPQARGTEDDMSESMQDEEPGADLPVGDAGAPSPDEPEAVASLRERLLRALADAENARRRAERSRSEGWRAGVAELASRLTSGLDSLDLAIKASPQQGQDPQAFAQAVQDGVAAARRELLDALEKAGVERIEPMGQAFDPQAHEAVAARPDASVPPGQVLEVVQAGYRLAERLIRPARVIVSSAAAESRDGARSSADASGAAQPLS